jgi:hypothetical protein
VLIALTGGNLVWDGRSGCFKANEGCALPQSLLQAFSEEPLYLDLRWASETKSAPRLSLGEPRFREAVPPIRSHYSQSSQR